MRLNLVFVLVSVQTYQKDSPFIGICHQSVGGNESKTVRTALIHLAEQTCFKDTEG